MKISVVITVLNEEKTIASLIEALESQTRKAYEVVFVDGGSEDKTIEVINHFQKKYPGIKLLIQKSSRAKGRNIGIEVAQGEIIAVTDAGCFPKKDWLENITKPFGNSRIDMVAGFYKMVAKSDFQKAETIFLGTLPSKFNLGFLPSSRSVAFRKSLWEKVGGYPEKLTGAAEDTVFNYKVIKSGAKISRTKGAVVEWEVPSTLESYFGKTFNYAKGDALSRIFFYPGKGLLSHNLKAIFVIFRYLVGLVLFSIGLTNINILVLLFFGLTVYFFWSYRKVYIEYPNINVAKWGIILQITSDVAVAGGFTNGIFKRNN